jgi:hypothetical protein
MSISSSLVGFIEKTRFGSKTATPAALNKGLQNFLYPTSVCLEADPEK